MEAVANIENIRAGRFIMVTSDFILDEVVTTVLARDGHNSAVIAGRFIFNSKVIQLVWLDQEMKFRAWDYFTRHNDKDYSFTDCTSFVLMKEMKITRYLSFDDHFRQAGFKCLA